MKLVGTTIIISSLLFFLLYQPILAQKVYKAEIGASTGISYYLGDLNTTPLNNMEGDYGAFLRYKLNSRIAIKGEMNTTQVTVRLPNNVRYSHWVTSADLIGEYNFFDLERSKYNRNSRVFSPYLFTGFGLIHEVYAGQPIPEIYLPLGLGFKWILTDRWNMNIQCNHKILLPIIKIDNHNNADHLENKSAFNNYHNLNGTNVFNNDILSTLSIGLSYNILEEQCECRNASIIRKR
jgi:hypothetical protein